MRYATADSSTTLSWVRHFWIVNVHIFGYEIIIIAYNWQSRTLYYTPLECERTGIPLLPFSTNTAIPNFDLDTVGLQNSGQQ